MINTRGLVYYYFKKKSSVIDYAVISIVVRAAGAKQLMLESAANSASNITVQTSGTVMRGHMVVQKSMAARQAVVKSRIELSATTRGL
jgi:hypothetical protein